MNDEPTRSLVAPTLTNTLLTEQIEGNAPAFTPQENTVGSAYASALGGTSGALRADPKKEYVSGGWYGPLGSYLQSLPPWIDDITHDFGPDMYERMGRDPHIFGETLAYKSAVLSQGVRLTPAVEGDAVEQDGDGFKQAKKVRDFCQTLLAGLDTPLIPLLRELLDAFGQGFKVAEVVYRQERSFGASPEERWLVPHKIKPKRREAVAFVVDSRMNVQGLLAALAGRETFAMSLTQIIDPAHTHNILPRAKFAVLSWDSLSDPRGKSQYRPCYDPWWLKQQTLAELQKFIAQAAGERLVGYTADDAKPMQAYNADGTPQYDSNGLPVQLHPQQAMLEAILQLRSGSGGAFPAGSKVEALASSTEGQAIFNALDYYDRQISKALLGQTLATNEGMHQARASSETGKDVMDLITEYGETLLADMIRRDILRVAVAINMGTKALKFLPLVSLSAGEEADISKLGTTVSQLFTAGYFSENQLAALDSKLGIPAADGERGTGAQRTMLPGVGQKAAPVAAPVPGVPADPKEPATDPAETTP